jgi:serine/threonine protein kinase
MAPEQATGGGIDERADVYALAAVAYQLLTGRVAHPGSLADLASLQLPPPPSELADLPPEVDEIVLRGLEPDREERWADVRSFVNSFQAVVPGSGRTLLVSPPAMPRSSGSGADDPLEAVDGRSRLFLALACLAVFLVCFGVALAVTETLRS